MMRALIRKLAMKKILFILSYACALTFCVWLAYYFLGMPSIGIDDAYIFFSYAKNLAAGKGFVYGNCPEVVEGCTSFLWTLICAASWWLHLNQFGVLVVAFVCLLLTHLTWFKLLHRTCGEELPVVVLAVFLLSSPAHLCWMSFTCMDVSLYALTVALLARVIFLPRENRLAASVLFAAVPLVRPEMMMLGPAALALYFVSGFIWKEWSCRRTRVFLYFFIFALSLGALTVFRMAYFGYPFPNTFYAKVSPSLFYNISAGFGYLALFISLGASACGLLIVFTGHFLPKWIHVRSPMLLLVAWFLILLAPPVLTGGDHFGYYRFYQPVYPLIGLLVAYSMASVWHSLKDSLLGCWNINRRAWLGAVLIGAIIGGALSFQPSWRTYRSFNEIDQEFVIAVAGIADGKSLNAVFAGGGGMPTVGVITAGGIGMAYKGKIVDLMGLNNVRVAHYKGERRGKKNHAAFEPAVFPELGVDVMVAECESPLLKGMTLDPGFASQWRFGRFERAGLSTRELLASKAYVEMAGHSGISFVDSAQWDGKKWSRIVAGGAR